MTDQTVMFDFETLIEEWCRINSVDKRSINTSFLRFRVKKRSTRWYIYSPVSSELTFTTTVKFNGPRKPNRLGVYMEPEARPDMVTITLQSGLLRNASKPILYLPQHNHRLPKVFRHCRIVNLTDPDPQVTEYDESPEEEGDDWVDEEEYAGTSYEEDEDEKNNEQFFSRKRRNFTAHVTCNENERKGIFECTVVVKGKVTIKSGVHQIDMWEIVHDLKNTHLEVDPEVQKMLNGLDVNLENNQVEFFLSGTAHFNWKSYQSVEWDY